MDKKYKKEKKEEVMWNRNFFLPRSVGKCRVWYNSQSISFIRYIYTHTYTRRNFEQGSGGTRVQTRRLFYLAFSLNSDRIVLKEGGYVLNFKLDFQVRFESFSFLFFFFFRGYFEEEFHSHKINAAYSN